MAGARAQQAAAEQPGRRQPAGADAQLDPQLVAKMASASAAENLQVVITYKQSVPVSAAQVGVLKSLGIDKGVTMRTLPIGTSYAVWVGIGAVLTVVVAMVTGAEADQVEQRLAAAFPGDGPVSTTFCGT